MWRKLLTAAIIGILAVLVLPAFALADASTVTMQGQATAVSGIRSTQVQLELSSNDARGWFITMSLNVPLIQRERDDEWEVEEVKYESSSAASNVNVSGYYTLGAQSRVLSTGTVAGTLNSGGTGTFKLSDSNKATSLSMSLTITGNGGVTAAVAGLWPPIPSTPPSAPAAGIAPAGPAPTASQAPSAPVAPVLPALTPSPAVVPAIPEPQPAQPANSHFFWYLSRTSAIAAYILLFINICLGIGLKTKYLDWLWQRARTLDLHQFTAIMGGSLILLHIFSLLGDSYFKFSVYELLVPGMSPYRPLWTAAGSVALYAGGCVALSFYIRRLIGQKTWRILHYASFALFFAILFHGINTGTDSSLPWMQWMYIASGTIVAFLLLWRFFSYRAGQAEKPAKVPIPIPR